MDSSSADTTVARTTTTLLQQGPSTPPPSPPSAVVLSPCAACKILRRRCVDRCVLAPYFPPTEPHKFATAHRVFGASNIIKLLQELPEENRADAVSSLVYEASARIRDPVYGCAGAICQLQRQVNDLNAQLARAHAELAGARDLLALVCMAEAASPSPASSTPSAEAYYCSAADYSSHLAADAMYVGDGVQAAGTVVGWGDEPLWA
ncbi:hypothetical protein PR202_gb25058 [Eleusine coracana subsp. coracana]|uniref:LOB domain-containing protein n=1 Tax=Eleusine coracana subsp. coracana TaxID=191504 RepID=A0AAV5FNC4_ELECO|nr:hypothetical protein QOZ80_5BG0454910 [Eleusine coracana subsp. coracana]GJN36218.1 hypothetical protein PR202_gb25058 [Eleusine coracana subsp. coracana]